ncbi:MAG: hypothetical protein ACYC7A_17375 [Thermoanaerobaculia bacterium]
MDVTDNELRVRMQHLSSDELRAIVHAPEGEYTAAALAIAQIELNLRPAATVDVGEESRTRSSSPVGSSLRALLALVFIWTAWVLFLLSFLLVFSLEPSSVLVGCLVAAFGGTLVWAARRLSDVFNGAFLFVGGTLASVLLWWRSKRRTLSAARAG